MNSQQSQTYGNFICQHIINRCKSVPLTTSSRVTFPPPTIKGIMKRLLLEKLTVKQLRDIAIKHNMLNEKVAMQIEETECFIEVISLNLSYGQLKMEV